MSFITHQFALFLLLSLCAYYLLPVKQWKVILFASLVFYFSWSPWAILYVCATTGIVYVASFATDKLQTRRDNWLTENKDADRQTKKDYKEQINRKVSEITVITTILMVLSLVVIKYYCPFAETVNDAFKKSLFFEPSFWVIPLGISYYSLTLLGYYLDVSREVISHEKNPLKILSFAIFFPAIVQGPFQRYGQFSVQFDSRIKFESKNIYFGLQRILWGAFKKMAIANQAAIAADALYAQNGIVTGAQFFVGIFCYAIQLYADFSGYMDIIIGVGEMFGINVPENFDTPFFSRSISEFWRRWHITLGAWLKDYVFYPILKSHWMQKLGKKCASKTNKKVSQFCTKYLGLLLLWTVIGAWHGADIKFIFGTGWLQFLYVFAEENLHAPTEKILSKIHISYDGKFWRCVQSCVVTFQMAFAWVFFRADSFAQAWNIIGSACKHMVQGWSSFITYLNFVNSTDYIIFIIEIICLAIVDCLHNKNVKIRESIACKNIAVRYLFYICAIWLFLLFGTFGGSASQFLYTQF